MTMTDAAAPVDDGSDRELKILLDTVNDDPAMLNVMTRSTIALAGMLQIMNAHSRTGQENEITAKLQEVALTMGIMSLRPPTEQELADPEWWGHAAGIAGREAQIIEVDEGIFEAVSVLSNRFGIDAEGEGS